MKRRNSYYGSDISFIDMLFNIIIIFVLLFVGTFPFMNIPAKKKDMEAKADLIITMTWPDMSPHDIDLWLKVPTGPTIGYSQKENSYAFLERDDRGVYNNFIMRDEEKVILPGRREVISFRGKVPGRYVANVHFFMAKSIELASTEDYDNKPVPVIVELIQINPTYKVLVRKEIILTSVKEERTAFSFLISDNNVSNIELDIEEPFILDRYSN